MVQSSFTMPVEPIEDYESAFETFTQKLCQNRKILVKILGETSNQANATIQYDLDIANKIKGEIAELQKKIESIREDVDSVRTDKDRAEREKQKLQHECDQLSMLLSQKVHDRDELKEMLMQHEQRLKEKEQLVESDERKRQEKISNMEKGMLLYQTHLGLKIQRTRHNTIVFIFTQVNRSDPNKEYLLELTLDENSYRLVTSDPAIPNLPELEQRLNATNNFAGCIFHIRSLFQKMDE